MWNVSWRDEDLKAIQVYEFPISVDLDVLELRSLIGLASVSVDKSLLIDRQPFLVDVPQYLTRNPDLLGVATYPGIELRAVSRLVEEAASTAALAEVGLLTHGQILAIYGSVLPSHILASLVGKGDLEGPQVDFTWNDNIWLLWNLQYLRVDVVTL